MRIMVMLVVMAQEHQGNCCARCAQQLQACKLCTVTCGVFLRSGPDSEEVLVVLTEKNGLMVPLDLLSEDRPSGVGQTYISFGLLSVKRHCGLEFPSLYPLLTWLHKPQFGNSGYIIWTRDFTCGLGAK
jgi:hypothetical protein